MDLSPDAIRDVVHPTALFPQLNRGSDRIPWDESQLSPRSRLRPNVELEREAWDSSQLNPKNRVDSLDLPEHPLWRIDGCTGLGTQYYAVPLFLAHIPPMRIDVFIPSVSSLSPLVCEVLDLNLAFHTKDKPRIRRLAISRHIVRKLQRWTGTEAGLTDGYVRLPFGSRIVFEDLSLHLDDIRVSIGKTTFLETQLLPRITLEQWWGQEGISLPPSIDIAEVDVIEQLHDSVALVRVSGEVLILKALTSYPKYLYHELKKLLTIPPHPNVVSRPINLVTKATAWGPRKVIGFTLEYHERGSMRDIVPFLRLHDELTPAVQLKWSIQVASALEHLLETSGTWYPDLRLDNIVVSAAADAVMVDFEQRGVWCEFGPPEVNYVEYIRILATDDDLPEEAGMPYRAMLERHLPDYEYLTTWDSYRKDDKGYNIPWLCLSPAEQEAAEVYMLGRVLWCIFEGVSGPQSAAVWQSYPRESDLEFPQYRHTPPPIRDLVDRCTRGRKPLLASLIVRNRGRLELSPQAAAAGEGDEQDLRRVAREWWEREVGEAMRFLEMRSDRKARGDWDENYFQRPRIAEVLEELQEFQRSLQ